MFKRIKSISIFLLTLLFLLSCVGSKSPKFPPLTIALYPFIGYNTAIIAQEKGFFKQQGVEVEIKHLGYNFQGVAQEFSAGKYDGLATPLGNFILMSATNPNIQTVMIIDETTGADVIVAQPQIKNITDLKGKNIGALLGDFSELFVIEMLKTANLVPDDVNLVPMNYHLIPQGLKSNLIQAGHTWEPFVSEAVKSGANILFTSKETPGLILDILTFRTEVINNRPDDIRAFIRGWLQGLAYWQTHLEEGNQIISKVLGVPLDTLSLDGIKMLNLQDNHQFFDPNHPHSIYKTSKIYLDFLIQSGNITRFPDLETLFNPTFLDSYLE